MGNIRAKLPEEGAEEVLAHARAVRDAPTHEAGEAQAAALIKRFEGVYPIAIKSFAEDLEASLAHLKSCRFATRSERQDHESCGEESFLEEKRRTKVSHASPTRRGDEAGVRHAHPDVGEVEQGIGLGAGAPAAQAVKPGARDRPAIG